MADGAEKYSKMLDEILQIVKSGDTAEVKREHGQIVVVRIKRKVKSKTPIIG
mgnify:FL=1